MEIFVKAGKVEKHKTGCLLLGTAEGKLRSEAAPESPTAPEATGRMDREERTLAVRHALEQLTERDRDVLLLWNAGQSYVEIAEETGLSPGAIGTTLSRARKRLVEAYDELERENVARNRR